MRRAAKYFVPARESDETSYRPTDNMKRNLRIGIDLDNTLAGYDHLFQVIGGEMGILPPGFVGRKKAVRDFVRRLPDGENQWIRMQAALYGPGMARARVEPGVLDFLAACRQNDIPVFVVSHRTRFAVAAPRGPNLHDAAMDWLDASGLFDPSSGGLLRDRVFFETARESKIERIATLGCTHFIDDLEELLLDPGFPGGVEGWLYDPHRVARPKDRMKVFVSWPALEWEVLRLAGDPRTLPIQIAGRLSGRQIESAEPIGGGFNNRVYCVQAGVERFALKTYFARIGDNRDRLGREFAALDFLGRHGVNGLVPKAIAFDRANSAALYEWVRGDRAGIPSVADVDIALELVRQLRTLSQDPEAGQFPAASAAWFRLDDAVQQLEHRIERLKAVSPFEPPLDRFLSETYLPAFGRWCESAERTFRGAGISTDKALDESQRILSPSDFGFHNVLRRPDGSLAFIDFEYFGWDDPAKLTADFFWHPGLHLDHALGRRFAAAAGDIFRGDRHFAARLDAYYRLCGLHWAAILLNEFLPDVWARRAMVGAEAAWDEVKERQLAQAQLLCRRVESGRGPFDA
jgi:hypothetical protein